MAYTSFNGEEHLPGESRLRDSLNNLLHYANQALKWLGKRTVAVVHALQYARMISVLHNLPDEQLTQAGMERNKIPEHAYKLIYGEK